jgi:AcrR family transcriptional regulator
LVDSIKQTTRSRNKATRKARLLEEAATLFAERGFTDVSLEELGSAVGFSGPAVYRHFPNKDTVLAELLIPASLELLNGGREAVKGATSSEEALHSLIRFQANFALRNGDLTRIQDRDLFNLSEESAGKVRSLQRNYMKLWIDTLRSLQPELTPSIARAKVHALLGLLRSNRQHSPSKAEYETDFILLVSMAAAAAAVPAPDYS